MTITAADLTALGLSLQLAAASTAILLVLGMPLAWWLARTRCRVRPLVDVLVALPLVLPPTVLGFYLLLMMGPDGPLGRLTALLHLQPLAFSFGGLVLGSVIYSLPFVVQPVRDAFAGVSDHVLESAATMGAGPRDSFFRVAVPLARRGLITGATLGFAHTLGEFGVVLMIGGNIPGVTQVASIAIYDHVEALDYGRAHLLSGTLLVLSFALLLVIQTVARRMPGVGR
jgi:molybdate transport system permease protein